MVEAVNKGGIYSYSTKPWDPTDLGLRIRQAYEVHALREEREALFNRYQQVFEASGDPIALVEDDGRILEVNPAAERLLGLSREQALQQNLFDRIESPAKLFKAMRARRRGREFPNTELTLLTPSGGVIDCLMTATYLGRSPEGRVRFQAMIKDITDRRAEEQRLRRLNSDLDRRVAVRTKQLQDALEDLGAFSYTVAHDLRSPLKNVLALSQLLQEHQPADDNDGRELNTRIQRGALRMLELVDDLLRLSTTTDRELQRTEVDLHSLVREVLEELPAAAHAPELVNHVPPGTALSADCSLLKVVLVNLLSNAVKFTRLAGAPRVEVRVDTDAKGHIIRVVDNGAGFDSTAAKAVFGAFKRMHGTDQFEGTGIGLAIVQRIVNKHGGEVWAESTIGQGTTISLRLDGAPAPVEITPFAS